MSLNLGYQLPAGSNGEKIMRALIFGLVVASLANAVSAQTYVQGYTTKSGTYVAPHYRSSPNSTTTDNWSVKPNVNPYTGQPGTKSPTYTTPNYNNPYAPKASSSCAYCSTSDGDSQ